MKIKNAVREKLCREQKQTARKAIFTLNPKLHIAFTYFSGFNTYFITLILIRIPI